MAKMTKKDREFLSEFHAGICSNAYEFLGARPIVKKNGGAGYVFRTWAPNAEGVSVVGDFNNWLPEANPMEAFDENGVWECFIPDIKDGEQYKYCFTSKNGNTLLKMDPYGFKTSSQPNNDSVTSVPTDYNWQDKEWQEGRAKLTKSRPINIYEVHLGSWMRGDDNRYLTYSQLADKLPEYVKEMGYTHIEIMPIMEYGFDGAWGYRTTCYYSPTFRYGDIHGFMELVDECHRHGIGVIMDWNIAHFPKESHGLIDLDGGCCYEYSDPMKQEHSQWDTRVFDYGREEVRSFLLSAAAFWVGQYHLDGLRFNNVSSMLYLDYGRENWQWSPNIQGGRENLEAVSLLQMINTVISTNFPGTLMIAEEFSPWPQVTGPVPFGGLGFTHKWNVAWTEDMMTYFSLAPTYRAYNHDKLVFSSMSAFDEQYILPLSHDEFVFGKRSLMDKMPGLEEEKLAGVRGFFAYMMAYPGKKMSFMGNEFGQSEQWNYRGQLQWFLEESVLHRATQRCVAKINAIYKENAPMWQLDDSKDGFYWIDAGNHMHNILSFARVDENGEEIIVVCNFSDKEQDYKMGLPYERRYQVLMNTNFAKFGGCDKNECTVVEPIPAEFGSFDQYAQMKLSPYGVLYLKAMDE